MAAYILSHAVQYDLVRAEDLIISLPREILRSPATLKTESRGFSYLLQLLIVIANLLIDLILPIRACLESGLSEVPAIGFPLTVNQLLPQGFISIRSLLVETRVIFVDDPVEVLIDAPDRRISSVTVVLCLQQILIVSICNILLILDLHIIGVLLLIHSLIEGVLQPGMVVVALHRHYNNII